MSSSLTPKRAGRRAGLYIGGGFPEVFAAHLEANASLRRSVRNRVEEGMPVYAECGGLIYLGRRVIWDNLAYDMAGALPYDVVMESKPQGHGYVIVDVVRENPFLPRTIEVRGHEFHNSRVINLDAENVAFAYRVKRGWGSDGEVDGILYKNVLASYTHLHALTVTDWAARFVQFASRQSRRSQRTAIVSRIED